MSNSDAESRSSDASDNSDFSDSDFDSDGSSDFDFRPDIPADKTYYDWDDFDFCEEMRAPFDGSDEARSPFPDAGRTALVRETLAKYGFDLSKKEDANQPSSCFEHRVRKLAASNLLEKLPTPAQLLEWIRVSELYKFDKPAQKLSDSELLTVVLGDAFTISIFWSFCRRGLEQRTQTWHCRLCGTCQDWRDWHCKGCNKVGCFRRGFRSM